ncbi:MAG: DUF4157 domain-containing protein [Williamsia sp.]|nr:DUF4157 domain-containing protein [Williamsia sp.]
MYAQPDGKQESMQKKPNNTGLPDKLKEGVENLSGYSMDDVKVHYNSDKPAQLQALAYAQGTDIHIGPGQEKHLPHEAWHVVQQKQGRVQATMQMKGGVAVNDDKVLEGEADQMGNKAKQSKRESVLQPVKDNILLQTIQRKVGFEFESTGDKTWRFQGKDSPQDEWAGISHTKDILLPTKNALAGASSDGGKVEFVTRPLSSWEEIVSTFSEMEGMVKDLKSNKITDLEGDENADAALKTGLKMHRVDTKNSDFAAKPQATIGISMMNIKELFNLLSKMSERGSPKAGEPVLEFDRAIGSKGAAYKVKISSDDSIKFLKEACILDKFNWDSLHESQKKEISGFLSVILKTLWDAYSNSGERAYGSEICIPFDAAYRFSLYANNA